MKQRWDETLAKDKATQTGYPEDQVLWLIGIMYRHHKSQVRTKNVISNLLEICKKEKVANLYSIYQFLIEGGIVKKKHIPLEYRKRMAELQRIKERPTIVENDWFNGFM